MQEKLENESCANLIIKQNEDKVIYFPSFRLFSLVGTIKIVPKSECAMILNF